MWKCFLHSLPVKDLPAKRGIMEDSTCGFCNKGSETIIHVLWDCEFGKSFWIGLGNLICDGRFFENDLCFWLKENLHPSQNVEENSIPWNVFFAFGTWGLWNHRNKRIFKKFEPNPRFAVEVNNVALNYFYVAGKSKAKTNQSPIMVRWAKLEEH